MTTEQEVKWAWRGAKLAGQKYRQDKGALVGAAWQQVRRLNATTPDADPALCIHAAYRGAVEFTRRLTGWGRAAPAREKDRGGEAAALATIPDREHAPPPEHRLLALWCEYRPVRAGRPALARLWAYLLRVEGWTLAEVAAAWGYHPNGVHRAVTKAGLTVQRKAGVARQRVADSVNN